MKVLFVSSGNSKFSISPIVKNQGLSLIDQGVDVEFFTISGKGFSSYFKYLFILRNKLKESSYNIIHAHFGLSGILSLISKSKEILVVSFMGDDLLGSNKADGSIYLKSQIIAVTNKWLSKIFYHATIVKSDEMVKKLGASGNLFLIANGIDLEKFKYLSKDECKNKLAWSNDEYHILFPANPERIEKNFALVENAIQLINGMEEINLHFTRDVSHDDIPKYMNASDLVVLSSFHEGSPNVIKEAMACNCPIVSTDVGDVRSVFGDTGGCYIASFDPADYAEKLKLALQFSQKQGKTNGRQRIIDLGLDSETIARKIIEVYNKVLNISD